MKFGNYTPLQGDKNDDLDITQNIKTKEDFEKLVFLNDSRNGILDVFMYQPIDETPRSQVTGIVGSG